jgi:hypothetical protein
MRARFQADQSFPSAESDVEYQKEARGTTRLEV